MRAIIQRVKQASVTVNGTAVSSIECGICVLVGIAATDTATDAEYIKKRILGMKLWPNDDGKPWKKNVADIGGSILSVSQFTLYATLKNSTMPTFHKSMRGEDAQQFYNKFLQDLSAEYDDSRVKDGVFGAMMDVNIVNDGPVTIIIDSNSPTGVSE